MCLSNQQRKDLIEYHQGSWTELTKDPESWLRKAEALKNAAEAVQGSFWPEKRKHNDTKAAVADFFQGPVYMLLAGLAVETLIKGIIVGANPDCVVQGNRLSDEFATHDLKELYRNAGLRENSQRNNLLLRLQHYVENFGRYPVTRSKNEMRRMLKTRFASDPDFAKVERLWAFLVSKIQTYISAGD